MSPISVTLEFVRDGTPELKLQRSLFDTAGRAVPCLTTVDFDRLRPGKYELRVTATNEDGSAAGVAKFSVEP